MTLSDKEAKQSEKKREWFAQKDRTQRDFLMRSIAAATTFAFFSPMVASADIISGDNAITTVTKENNIYTVESHKYFDNSAVNWFSQFGLGANEIANLYFGTKADNSKLNLFNFVDSKIDVNGTVNALQNNKIGGNLFFLSREGVAVGAGGVINAGSLTLLTPSEGYYENFIKDGAWNTSMDADAFSAEMVKMAEMNIPLNPSGEIVVKGKVYAPNGIGMKASSITVDSAAQLKTGNIDFTDLVNAGATDNTVFDGSQNLTATMTDSGDIVLSAYSDVRNKKDEAFTQTVMGITGDEETLANNNTIEASVTSKGTIDAAGDVSITAEAANGQEFYAGKFDEPSGLGTNETAAYQIAQSVAKIEVADGSVSGQNVTISANADNSYIDNDSLAKMIGINVLGAVTVNMDAAYAVLGGKASVDIGAPAVIEAKNSARTDSEGKSINALSVTANSRVQGSVGATTAAMKLGNIKGANVIPSTAVSYIEVDNEAAVNINGTLKSAGNTKIDATAETQMNASAASKTPTVGNAQESIADIAVVVANGDTSAKVMIGETAQMTSDNGEANLDGDLAISAITKNQIHTTAEASGGDGALGATAVNVTTYDSDADVTIGASLEAEDISVTAGNAITDNTVTADNAMGNSMFMAMLSDAVASSHTVAAVTNDLLPAITNWMPSKVQKAILDAPDANFAGETGKLISIGASVTVAEEKNKANITVKKDAGITARGTMPSDPNGKVSLIANNNILDTKMSAVGKTNNNGKTGTDQAMVSAGVLVADIDNEANVVVEGRTSNDVGKISGGDIAINAANTMAYNRVTAMIGELLWAVDKVEASLNLPADYRAKMDAFKQDLNDAQTEMANDPNYVENTEFLDLARSLGQAADQLVLDAEDLGLYQQVFVDGISVFDIFTKAASLTDLNNYSNFTVNNTTGGKAFNEGGAKAAIAGNLNLATVSHTGRVLVGKNTTINASGKLDIAASGNADSVNVTGGLPGGTGSKVGLGGSFSLQRFDVENVTMVAEGAQLSGSAIGLTAENDVVQVGVVTQSGISGSVALNGMVNLMLGDSNSLVFVDDEASLSATEAATGTIMAGVNDGSITLDAQNDTVITNVAGGFSMGDNVSVGVGLALTDYTINNMAGIVDNDSDAEYKETDEANTDASAKRKNSVAQAMQAARAASGLTNEQSASLFGASATNTVGAITANSLSADALTEGIVNSVSVAGSVAMTDDSGQKGIFEKMTDWFMDTKLMKGIKTVETKAVNLMGRLDGKIGGTIHDKFGSDVNNALNTAPADQGGGNNHPNPNTMHTQSVNIAAAGSASVNLLDKNTGAVIDGANIMLHENAISGQGSSLSANAKDESFAGAWSGSAGITWKTTTVEANRQATVGAAGAVGLNMLTGSVQSTIADSVIVNADTITNAALSQGAAVAAGLGAGVTIADGTQAGANIDVTAAVSMNDVDNRVYALMEDDTVSRTDEDKTDITTSALSEDTQVTGGVNAAVAAGGSFGASVGGAATIGCLSNDVQAGISGGSYTGIGDMDVSSLLATRQVGGAVGVGVQAGSEKGFAFEGAAVYNTIDNSANAFIDGATITADSVNAVAKDTIRSADEWEEYIEARGLEADGASVQTNATSIDEVGTLDNDGSLIVSAALAVAGSSGNAGVAGAVAIDEITNDRTALISNSTITANNVSAKADADSLLVGVVAGGGGSASFGGTGSVGWHEIENDVTATVDKSAVTADKLDVLADNDALLINVVGQVSAGKNAFGAAVAYQGIDNTTGAYITGSDMTGRHDDGIAVSAKGLNSGDIISVGAGVGAATETAAVNGTVAINRGANDTQAIIGKSEDGTRSVITDAKSIAIEANDNTNLVGVAGGIGASKTAAVGGAVAYNDIGGSALSTERATQNVTAGLDDTDITTKSADTVISVGAHDDADITTAAVGVGGSGTAAVEGASATSLINKNVSATMSNTNIDQNTASASRANVTVTADNTSDIDGSASVVAGSGTAAVGAGVTINRVQQDTSALLSGGKQNVNGIVVKSTSQPTIFSVGIGGSVGGTAGITGSAAVNIIEDNSIAQIMGGADITAEGSVGVISENDQIISNYAGTLSGSGTAAVGASVSVNLLTGDSNASVSDAKITAKGNSTHTVMTKSDVADDAIVDTIVSENSVDSTNNLKNKRSTKTHTGLVVDSSATRDLRSFMLTAAGSGSASVEAAVNVNSIEGSTIATVDNSTINEGGASTNGNVEIRAHDYTNSTGLVGGAAGAMYAGIVPASDTNLLDRTVRASVTDKMANDNNKMTIYANDMSVSAESKQGISSFGVGAAGAIEGAAVGAVVSVTTTDGITEAVVEDATITAETSSVKADHLGRTNAGNIVGGAAAIGAGIGAGVGVNVDDSVTRAHIADSTIKTSGANNIEASNRTEVRQGFISVGVAAVGGGVAGTVIVNNIDNMVETVVDSSILAGKTVQVKADNQIDIFESSGSAGVGVVGAGVGAGVAVNTIDSRTTTAVTDSEITAADDVIIRAEETRDIEQIVGSGGFGIGSINANVMVTNVGKTIDETNMKIDTVTQTAADGTTTETDIDIKGLIDYANEEFADDFSQYTIGLTAEEAQKFDAAQSKANYGSGDAITATAVSGSTIKANDRADISAEVFEDIHMLNANGAVGGIDVLATVGTANVHHNVKTDIVGGTDIAAKTIDAKAKVGDLDGKGILIKTVQGSVGAATIGAAVGIADTEGKIALNVGDSTLSADSISLRGEDTTTTKSEALGVQVGAVAIGAIVAQADNDSNVYVTASNSKINQGKTSGSAEIFANKANTISAFVQGGTGGLANGIGLRTDVTDNGDAELSIAGGEFGGKTVSMQAKNAPSVTSKVDNDTYGALAVQVGLVNASADVDANLTVSGSKLLADTVTIGSTVGTSGVTTVKADLVSVNGTGIEGSGNVAAAELTADSTVSVTNATYKSATDLTVTSDTDTTTEADVESLNIGILVTTGNNKAVAKTVNNTSVTLGGTASVKSLTVKANGSADSDARAESEGGGAINASEAARAENDLTTNTKIDLGGDWTVAGAATIEATQKDRANMNAYAVRGGAYSGTGIVGKMNVKGATDTKLSGSITADTVSALAKNNITTGDAYTYAVQGSNYGAVITGDNDANLTVDKSANANIAADITTKKAQTYEALTDADIKNRSTLKVVEAFGSSTSDTYTITDIENKVTLGENKTLRTESGGQDGNITLAASDTLDITATAETDIPSSVSGGATANTDVDTTHSNTIEVKGKIYSMNDINLYAGKDAQGKDTSLTMDVESAAYNKVSFIPITDPNINNQLTQSNQVIVADTGVGESVRHINVSADVGEESIREKSGCFTWYNGGTDENVSYVGASEGTAMKSKTAANMVQADGTLKAGTNKSQTVVISGHVAPPGTKVADGTGDTNFTVTVNGETMEGAVVSTMDYGNMLFVQYQETTKLMNEYKGKYDEGGSTKDLSAYLGYKAEQERILAQMDSAGLLMKVTQDGHTEYMPIEGYQIYVIELPDITSSGGNITVDTDTLSGIGSLIAQGSPQIDITNESTAYLKVNDLIVGSLGGELIYKGNSIKANDHQAIENLNINKDASVTFAAIKTDDPSSGEAKISILSTDVQSKPIVSTGSETIGVSSGNIDWTPIKTIDINGVVSNPNGIAAITNEAGDIILQDNAGIEAKTIDLMATGSVAQGVTEGIVNIGGNPEQQWADHANTQQNTAQSALEENGFENDTHAKIETELTDASTQNGSWIVGGEVYISASDINVNGTIQSGFSQYQVTIDNDDIMNINANDASNVAYIDGTKVYKINNGNRAVLQSDGTYAFEVQAYYDPASDKIFIDDIESRGGKVYLTGRIASTGNGKIVALDGGAKIDIVSTASKDMVVGKIINNNIDGLIRITDLNKMQELEVTSTGSTLTDMKTGNVQTVFDTPLSYAVKEGLRYNWTTGTETTEEKTYQNDIKEGMWGAYEVSDETALDEYEQTHSPTSSLPEETRDKMSGVYIDNVDEIGNRGSDYVLIYDNDKKTEERSETEKWTSTSGFLGWYHWTHYRWTVTTGSAQTYQHSIKADHEIGLKFIKGADDQSINISGAQNVALDGSIANAAAGSMLSVTAGGSITQTDGTKITGGNIGMTAQTGVTGIDITAMERSVNVHDVYTQVQTTAGNIDVTVDGDMLVKTISTGNGTVDLTATGDINNFDTTTSLVSGDRIDLTSGDTIDLTIKGGQTPTTDSMSASVNAFARNDIGLTQSEGDIRVGTIASQQGDVTIIAANGNIVDVLPTVEPDTDSSTETRIQRWKDFGLIEGEGAYTQEREKQAITYQEGVTKAYAYYTQQKAYYEANPNEEKSAVYLKFAEIFNGYDSADAFLAEQAEYQDLTKTLTASDYGWTKEHLLYAIHDSVINKTGVTHQDKTANITGKNITLSAEAGGIGSGSQTKEIVSLTTIDGLKRLSTAENSDVEWYEGDNLYTDENGTQYSNVAVIEDKAPLGIAASGTVAISAKNDIYLAGRDASMENVVDSLYEELKIGHITSTEGDVRLLGEKKLIAGDNSYHVSGKDVILEGGEGGIGAADSPIIVQVDGELTARSEGDLYIQQKESDLVISALYASGDAKISSEKAILSEPDDVGYVNVQGSLALEAGDNIGSATEGLRVLAGGGAVSASADNIYLDGQAEKGVADSTLILGNMTAEDVVEVMSDSSIETIGTIVATGVSEESGYSVYLQSENDITLTDGMIEASVIGLDTESQLTQAEEHTLDGDLVAVWAKEGITLDGANNRIEELHLDNAQGDIRVNNTGDLYLSAEENEGNIIVTNTDGNLALQSSLSATGTGSDIVLDNTNGDICFNDKNITADSDVTIQTHTVGSIMGTGIVTATTGTVTMQTDIGNIIVTSVSAGDAELNTTKGDITIGNLTSMGNATVSTAEGGIGIGTLDADGDAAIEAVTGNIVVDTADVEGSADITTTTGDITVNTANVEGSADITADTGSVTVDTVTVAGDAKVTTETGDITIDEADVAGTTTIMTQVQGNIGINELTSTGDATVGTTTGNITINELVSEESATIQTVVGAIDANRITADDLVKVTVAEEGDITSNDVIQSLNDSVTVYTAKGDVDLAAVYAKQDASVGSGDGDVTVYTIDGENVIFTVENSDKKLTADTVTAGERVDITSSKTNIDTIKQRDDHDNMLIISAKSPDEDMPFDYLNINHIVTDNGAIMPELYGDVVRMHVDTERFYLPKLRIGKVGYFSTNSTSVTLYGMAPWLDRSNIQLWHDSTELGKWTSLAFLAPKTIFTDAVYLNGDDWYDVYRQRMSGVDMMRLNLARENSLYRLSTEAERSAEVYAPFSRYLLIDDSHWLSYLPPIAAEDDIVIEDTI